MFAVSSEITPAFLELFRSERCLAIGECGLDPRAPLTLEKQQDLFLRHADAAEELGKPLIIHSVRTRLEMIRLRKKRQPSVPWIVHGCRGTAQRVREWADAGFVLSFGEGILRDGALLADLLPALPPEVILMETLW